MGKKKLFDVVIRNIKYPVYDIPENNIDGNTKWVEISSYPLYSDVEYVQYNNSVNRINWDIQIKMGNSVGTTDMNPNKHIIGYTHIVLKVHDHEVYSFYAKNIDEGYTKIRNIIYKLEKLPVDLYNMNNLKGKKIYYKGLPSKIIGFLSDGQIVIEADCDKIMYDKWWDSLIEPWFNDNDVKNIDDCKHYNRIKVNIIDDNIHWSRNDRKSKLMKIKRLLK